MAHTPTVKQVNRLVTAYLRDASESLENAAGTAVPDLKAIATAASAPDMVMVGMTVSFATPGLTR